MKVISHYTKNLLKYHLESSILKINYFGEFQTFTMLKLVINSGFQNFVKIYRLIHNFFSIKQINI